MTPTMMLALVAVDRRQRRENDPAGQFLDDVVIEISTTTGKTIDKNTTRASLKRLKEAGLVKNGDRKKGWGDLWLLSAKGNAVMDALHALGLPKDVM